MVRTISISLLLLALAALQAMAQQISPETESVRLIYTGMVSFPEGERCVEIEIVRSPLVVESGGRYMMRGWAFSGSLSIWQKDIYNLFGTSKSLDDPAANWWDVVLTVEDFDDSIVGTFEGRFDSAGSFHAVWRPSVNSSAATLCTLELLREKIDDNRGYVDIAFISFWKEFQAAVRKREGRRVARMVEFPLPAMHCLIGDFESENPYMGRRHFIGRFSDIFDERTTQAILSISAVEISTNIYRRCEGCYHIPVPEGALIYSFWFNPYSEASTGLEFAKVNGVYKLVEVGCAG